MSTDTPQDPADMDFQTFLEFVFRVMAREKEAHPDPEQFVAKLKSVITTIAVIMIAGATELGALTTGTDDIFDEDAPDADKVVKDYLKEVYQAYNVLRTLKETGPTDPD
tara:strand:- start:1492 stop:1818 length:327 start_codon:yes stop_codon:yes gene_type:complete